MKASRLKRIRPQKFRFEHEIRFCPEISFRPEIWFDPERLEIKKLHPHFTLSVFLKTLKHKRTNPAAPVNPS